VWALPGTPALRGTPAVREIPEIPALREIPEIPAQAEAEGEQLDFGAWLVAHTLIFIIFLAAMVGGEPPVAPKFLTPLTLLIREVGAVPAVQAHPVREETRVQQDPPVIQVLLGIRGLLDQLPLQ
jgi:hypothetical protein